MALQPQRTIHELKELRALTGNDDGAQRVAFTDTWSKARTWMREKLDGLPVEYETDEAGNVWVTLPGASDNTMLIGGHIDSVPNGGWLDGCLNVMAGLEVLRRIAEEGTPPVTVRLVDWADEEGARFGRSLFGSSAASNTMDPNELRDLKDRDGISLVDAIGKYGIKLDTAKQAHKQLQNAKAYLELHIEQGPVLESLNLPMGVVLGTFGVERHSIKFTGQAAHSGSTPMDKRKDALGGVSKLHLEIREIAKRHGGVCTVGKVETKPGIVTSVVAEATMTLDQRHLDADGLAAMYHDAQEASYRFAEEEKIGVEWSKLWDIHPILFNPDLIELADAAINETCGVSYRLPSGPLHDAAEVARAGVPTIMLFVQSLYGISHNKIEDTKEEHLALSVQALDRLATKTMDWILKQ
jgi:beta-ureidopropionase / N-carbamoyl-L-amino-acid hydrolase